MLRYTTYSNVPQVIKKISFGSASFYTVFSNGYRALLECQKRYQDKNVYKSPQERDIKKSIPIEYIKVINIAA
ncbi:MAG: hypothetical protein KBC27_01300 [Rickettsiales bacterium]|nr:hypothetical protein [Rickettsiales bacterium]